MLLRAIQPSHFGTQNAFSHRNRGIRHSSAAMQAPAIHEADRSETLVIGVRLAPAEVHQQWRTLEPTSVQLGQSRPILQVSGLSIFSETSTRARNGVQYHLKLRALNDYSDAQALPRVPVETGTKIYPCEVFTRLTQLILPSLEAPKLCSPTFLEHFAMLFCAHVVHIHSNGIPESPRSRGGLSAWQKRVATDILARNRYENTKLSTLAQECHLSVSHFARSFKTSFGQPVHRWLVNQRVEKSKDLLLHSNAPLLEVAFQAGFTDQATFNRTFAKMVGTSPGRWRKAFKED